MMLHLLHALAHHGLSDETLVERINAELLRTHAICNFVKLTPEGGVTIGSLHVLTTLLVDSYNEGHRAAKLGERLETLMVQRAAPAECDHDSPRQATSGIGAGICGDCGKFVGKRRAPGPTGSGL